MNLKKLDLSQTFAKNDIKILDDRSKKVNKIVALVIFIISTLTYLVTVAPTTSFWDCGEFIATAYTMSVPHPPGAPFFLLLGRIFSLFPGDTGFNVNLISVFSSAFTVLFLYLITVKIILCWHPVKEKLDRIIVFGSSAIGALTFCFTETFWFNAVEAEVYALSMFFVSIIIWLLMCWIEDYKNDYSIRYIILIMLLVGLGTGVHLLNILTIPTILFIMWFFNKRMAFITTIGSISSLLVLFALPLDYKIGSIFVFLFLTILYARSEENQDISLAFIMPLFFIIGYSTYLMIYIRANLNPPINENDPSTWEQMLSYLKREQYGDEPQLTNAVKLMFGDIKNRKYLESLAKIGVKPGSSEDPWGSSFSFFIDYQIIYMYIRYFAWQFIGKNMENIKQIISFNGLLGIPFLIGIWGTIHHFLKDKVKSLGFIALFLIMSVGLVIYQNQDFLQPRERDYFYVGSFFVFSMWIGIGVYSILNSLKEIKKQNLVIPVLIITLILPGLELKTNYFRSNRADYMAWDYSKNLMESCDENAILFTNGDNDTFPLWYLQEVENVRPDIILVNLSLLNTHWYIKQLRDKFLTHEKKYGLKPLVNYSNKYIEENFNPKNELFMRNLAKLYWPKPKTLHFPGKTDSNVVEWELKPTRKINTGKSEEGFLRIQDRMVLEIVSKNAQYNWQRPIYFAVTVASSNYVNLDNYMRMDGLAFRIMDTKHNQQINPKVTYDRILNKFVKHYRKLDDKSVYYNPNKIRLVQNYRSAFLQLADWYINETDITNTLSNKDLQSSKLYTFDEFDKFSRYDKINYILNKMDEYIPSENIPITHPRHIIQLIKLYKQLGKKDKIKSLVDTFDISSESDQNISAIIFHMCSNGLYQEASNIIKKMIIKYKSNDYKERAAIFIRLYEFLIRYKFNEVANSLEKELEKDIQTTNIAAYKNYMYEALAIVNFQNKNADKALLIIDKADENKRSLQVKLEILLADKQYQKASKLLETIIKKYPEDKDMQNKKKLLDKLQKK